MINVDKILGQILNAGQMVDGNPFDGRAEGKPFDAKSLSSGLLVGGLAGAMMGKTGKKIAGTAAQLGGAAAIAGLAYSAYQRYRAGQVPGGASSTIAAKPAAGPWGQPGQGDGADVGSLQEAHFLPASTDAKATESLSLKLIRAMIAAAKADGQIDTAETDRIFGQIDSLGLNDEERAFLLSEINKPCGVREIAAAAATPEEAAEIYAASVMAVNPNGLAERLYLGELVRLLKLDAALAKTIQDRMRAPA